MAKCEVCQEREADGIVSSIFGAASVAYCNECLIAMREPYATMLGGLVGIKSLMDVAPWARPYVEATLEFYGKTVDEFVAECQALAGEPE